MNVKYLLDQSYEGRIKQEELNHVLERIQNYYENPNEDDIHSLLQVVGYAAIFGNVGDIIDYKWIVEPFIVFPKDPFVSTTALEVLCLDWDLTATYIDQIKSFMRGVEWDTSMDVRVSALCIAGEYVKEKGNRECLKILLEIFENKQEQKRIRQVAYSSICSALGRDGKKPLEEIELETLSQNAVAQETIAKAYDRLTIRIVSIVRQHARSITKLSKFVGDFKCNGRADNFDRVTGLYKSFSALTLPPTDSLGYTSQLLNVKKWGLNDSVIKRSKPISSHKINPLSSDSPKDSLIERQATCALRR